MARRFGGRYSPDAAPGAPGRGALADRRVDAAGAKANLLFVPPAVLALTSLGEPPGQLLVGLAGAAVLTLGAWLLREGLRAEAAFAARKVARRPALPRKILAAGLAGLGTAAAAWTGETALAGAALYGIAATGLHLAAFGIDPMGDKRIEGLDDFQQDRVARVVDEAEAHLDEIGQAIARTDARDLRARVESFCATARRMIRTVEEDPRELAGARRYLGVYLLGARDATLKFVDIWQKKHDARARTAYEALLEDLERNFAARTEKMLLDDRSDMDIEIKVLRDRLQREGV